MLSHPQRPFLGECLHSVGVLQGLTLFGQIPRLQSRVSAIIGAQCPDSSDSNAAQSLCVSG